MQFVKHPKHNLYMGRPVDWDEATQGPCGNLSILDNRHMKPNPYMESCWEPQGFEALSLAMGMADIRLAIFGFVHPPVSMVVYPKTGVTTELRKQALQNVLHELCQYANNCGLSVEVNAPNDSTERSIIIGDHNV